MKHLSIHIKRDKYRQLKSAISVHDGFCFQINIGSSLTPNEWLKQTNKQKTHNLRFYRVLWISQLQVNNYKRVNFNIIIIIGTYIGFKFKFS